MIVTETDERTMEGRIDTVVAYGVMLWDGLATASAATDFFTVRDATVEQVLAWAGEQGRDFSIGAFVGHYPADPEPRWVWLLGDDPNDAFHIEGRPGALRRSEE